MAIAARFSVGIAALLMISARSSPAAEMMFAPGPPTEPTTAIFAGVRAVGTSTRIVWLDRRASAAWRPFTALLASDGTLSPAQGAAMSLPDAISPPNVTALVRGATSDLFIGPGLARIGLDGVPIDTTWAGYNYGGAVWTGTRWLVVRFTTTAEWTIAPLGTDGVLGSNTVIAPFVSVYYPPILAWNGSRGYVAFRRCSSGTCVMRARLVDEAGSLIGTELAAPTNGYPGSGSIVARTGGGFAMSVRGAPDNPDCTSGVCLFLLDAAGATTSKVVVTTEHPGVSRVVVANVGGSLWVGWGTSVRRFDAAGVAIDVAPVTYATVPSLSKLHDFGELAGGAYAVIDSTLYVLGADAKLKTSTVYARTFPAQRAPAVATHATDGLVVWNEGGEVRAARFLNDGTVLDTTSLLIGAGNNATAIANGTGWSVGWIDGANIRVRSVSATGVLGTPLSFALPVSRTPGLVRLARATDAVWATFTTDEGRCTEGCAGQDSEFLHAWAVRIPDSGGVGTPQYVLRQRVPPGAVKLACFDTRCLVAAGALTVAFNATTVGPQTLQGFASWWLGRTATGYLGIIHEGGKLVGRPIPPTIAPGGSSDGGIADATTPAPAVPGIDLVAAAMPPTTVAFEKDRGIAAWSAPAMVRRFVLPGGTSDESIGGSANEIAVAGPEAAVAWTAFDPDPTRLSVRLRVRTLGAWPPAADAGSIEAGYDAADDASADVAEDTIVDAAPSADTAMEDTVVDSTTVDTETAADTGTAPAAADAGGGGGCHYGRNASLSAVLLSAVLAALIGGRRRR